MIEYTVAKRYAKALFDVARDANEVKAYGEQVRTLADELEAHENLRQVLYGSLFTGESRKAILSEIANKLALDKNVRNFAMLLVDKNRLRYLPAIATEYRRAADEAAGRTRGKVRTAIDLDPKAQERIAAKLSEIVGREVVCNFETEPELLGGVRAEIGSLVLDGTVRTQLDRLTHMLEQG